MTPLSAHLCLGDVLAMPTCNREKSGKPHRKLLFLIGYVGCLGTLACAIFSTVDAQGVDAGDSVKEKPRPVPLADGPETSSKGSEGKSVAAAAEGANVQKNDHDVSSSVSEAGPTQQGEHRLRGPAFEVETGSGINDVGQCTMADAATIFWRQSEDIFKTTPPTDVEQGEDNLLPKTLEPSNPFYALLLSCGRSTLADIDATKICVQRGLENYKKKPLSEGCLECYMLSIECGAKNCHFACFADSCAQSCIECNENNCRPTLMKCTGLSELPPLCEERQGSMPLQEKTAEPLPQQGGWREIYASLGIPPEENE